MHLTFLCDLFRRKKKKRLPAEPSAWVLPGGVFAFPMQPTALMDAIHDEYLDTHPDSAERSVRWYRVPIEETKGGPDPRFFVEHEGASEGSSGDWTHGFNSGDRIALSPHGIGSASTILHELKHVYGHSHDRQTWDDGEPL